MLLLERTRRGQRQPNQHWTYLEDNVRETLGVGGGWGEGGRMRHIWSFPSAKILTSTELNRST